MTASDAVAAANEHLEVIKAAIGAAGVVVAALVAAGGATLGANLITGRLQRKRDEQDRESQWRTHAIELTKLDAERIFRRAAPEQRLRPLILTFLANYRDLQELGTRTPAELYEIIRARRINQPARSPTIVIGERAPTVIACAGSREGGGHPRVFLTVSSDEVVCPYCSRRYLLSPTGHDLSPSFPPEPPGS